LIYCEGFVGFQHCDAAEVEFADLEGFCAGFFVYVKDLEETVLADRQQAVWLRF
jgi:hypothetical protein